MTQLQLVRKSTASSSSDNDLILLSIPPHDVGRSWPLVEGHISRATDLTEKVDIEDIPHLIASGAMQLWVPWDTNKGEALGAVITELLTHTNGYRVARILLLGGVTFRRWGWLIECIEKWAVNEGCEAVEMIGRKGWGRWFPDYAPIEYVFSKEL